MKPSGVTCRWGELTEKITHSCWMPQRIDLESSRIQLAWTLSCANLARRESTESGVSDMARKRMLLAEGRTTQRLPRMCLRSRCCW
eukprot:6181276-Pleurochrysis_carterae.AAC.4